MFKFLQRRRKISKKKGGMGIIALDLGSETIKTLLFVVEKKHHTDGKLLDKRGIVKGFSQRLQKDKESHGEMVTDITNVIENCKIGIQEAGLMAKITPSQLIVGVGGEAVKGIALKLTHKREDPHAKINLSELHNIIHKLEWKAFGETRKKISEEMGYPEIDIKLLDAAIIDIKIDGYKVSNPLGFQGKEVAMVLFNAFTPLVHFEALYNISDHLELELLGITSEAYALSRCLDLKEANDSAIFIDIGGGRTDIAVVDKGALKGTKMFGIGGRNFTKRLAIELNIAFEEAEKLKRAYAEDKLDQKSKKIINTVLENDIETWLEGVVLSLSEFKKTKVLPSKILLSGGGANLPEIKNALNNRKWYKKLAFVHTPHASFIRPGDLKNLIDESKSINNHQNITVASLVNIGIELSGEETLIQKTLRKVIGIMKV